MKRILLIEDNTEIRENTAEILELADYLVETAENGKAGVELAKTKNYDLIICDIMMPELNGYGVLNILSKDPRTSVVPFIFLTAKTENSDFRKGMNLGADDYLTKPFENSDLLDAIELRLKKAKKYETLHEVKSPASGAEFIDKVRDDISIDSLIHERNIKTFRKKDLIYRQDEFPHALHYIKEGTVKLARSNEVGKEFIVRLCGPGEFIGYLALLENGPYTENAVAMQDCTLALISKTEFNQLIYADRDVANNFIKLLSRNLIEHERRLLKLAYGNLRERVAGVIVNLYEQYGDETHRIGLGISREELAGYTGIATESLSRTLSEFRSEGLIGNDGKLITVHNLERLKTISSGSI